MEGGINKLIVSWLDWAATWARDDPYDLLSKLFIILLPLFLISGALAFYLAKEIDKDNKKKEKKENRTKAIKKAAKKKKPKQS